MSPAPIKKIGIIVKLKVAEASNLALQVANFLTNRGKQVYFASESQELCSQVLSTKCLEKPDIVNECDLIVVLGGDGTFLSVARLMELRSVPILGINMGTLGFLTEVRKDEAFTILDQAIEGHFTVSERTLLMCSVWRNDEKLHHSIIVNDAVVGKSSIARMIELELFVNDNLLTNLRADGLIIGTPTGSTAYALAAGGPIIEPTVPAFVIAPICPHSLALRPLIVDDKSQLKVTVRHSGEAILTLDGQASLPLENGDLVRLNCFTDHKLQVVQAPGRNYFNLLRDKLKYGYRN